MEGRTDNAVKGEAISAPSGSEAVARCQKDGAGTREAQSVPQFEVCNTKPINGEVLQTTLWESDQPIVPVKQGNAPAYAGGGAGRNAMGRQGHILHTQRWAKDVTPISIEDLKLAKNNATNRLDFTFPLAVELILY